MHMAQAPLIYTGLARCSLVKTLILCVDRDDDLGSKAGVESPVVGRRRVLDAATKMGVADPEDSDTNALFAAVHLFDREQRTARTERQWEVAAVAGHRLVGLRSDREIARQLEEILDVTHADEVVLVSDGAEDEQILPIITSRVKVAHVHRSIVKQAPRLEGFYYTLTRMLDDDKLAKRYVLPLGLIFVLWGLAVLADFMYQAGGLTLAIAGGWLVVHALHWEGNITRFFQDFYEGMRTGKVTLVANLAALVLVILGGFMAWQQMAREGTALMIVSFTQEFFWYFVSALLVRTTGKLFDGWVREGHVGMGNWTALFSLIAVGFIGSVVLDLTVDVMGDTPLEQALTFGLVLRLVSGVLIAMSGLLLVKYLRTFAEPSV